MMSDDTLLNDDVEETEGEKEETDMPEGAELGEGDFEDDFSEGLLGDFNEEDDEEEDY